MACLWIFHQILMVFFFHDLNTSDTAANGAANGSSRSSSFDSLMPETTTETPITTSTWKEMAMGKNTFLLP